MGLIKKCHKAISRQPAIKSWLKNREKQRYIQSRNQRYPQFRWEAGPSSPQERVEAARMQVESKLFIFGGYVTIGSVCHRVDLFDLETHCWQQVGALPDDAAQTHNGTAYDGRSHIYLISGQLGPNCSPASTSCFAFNIRTYQWTKLPPLPEGRYMPLVHFHDGRIHCISGTMPDRFSPSDQHWSLSVVDGQSAETEWTRHAPVPSPCTHAASYLLNDEMFVFGGQIGDVPAIEGSSEYLCNFNSVLNESFNEVYTYNLKTGAYKPLEPMPEKLSHSEHAILKIGSNIIIAGGVRNRHHLSDIILKYDLLSNKWSKIGRLPYAMKSKIGAYWKERLYIVTGQRSRSETDLSPLEVLDTVWYASFSPDSSTQ